MARKLCPWETKSRQRAFRELIGYLYANFIPQDGPILVMPGTYVSCIKRCFHLYFDILQYNPHRAVMVEKEKSIRGLRAYVDKQNMPWCAVWRDDIHNVIEEGAHTEKDQQIDFVEVDTTESFANAIKQDTLRTLVERQTRYIWMCGSNRNVGTRKSRNIMRKILGRKYKFETSTFRGVNGHQMILMVAIRKT